MKKILPLFILVFSVTSLPAQNTDKAKLDRLFDLIETENQGMGRISVFLNNEEVYARSYGYADIATGTIANENTKFRIASITKTFTATVIMKLVEEGKLALDDKLDKYYPDVPNAGIITVRELLSHRTGFGRRLDGANSTSRTREEVFSKIPSFATGGLGQHGKYEYGNINFVLLTYIAEDVSGKSFVRLLDDIIINPLGLKNTFLWGKSMAQTEAQSYRRNDRWILSSQREVMLPGGAGGLLSTPHDINVFINALAEGKIISSESFRLMLPAGSYGLGIMPMNYKNIRGYGHNGIFGIYKSLLRYYPGMKLSIAITSNATVYPNARIADNVLRIMLGEEGYKYPDFTETITPEQDSE